MVGRTGSGLGGTLTVNGTLVLNGEKPTIAMSTIAFNGTVQYGYAGVQTIAQAINSGAAPSAYTNLTVNSGTTLNETTDVTVSSTLALTSGDITTGANTLTLVEGVTTGGTGDVWGNVKRTGTLVTGKTYSFGNPNVSLSFASATTMPTDVTINLAAGTPSGFANAIGRNYPLRRTAAAATRPRCGCTTWTAN